MDPLTLTAVLAASIGGAGLGLFSGMVPGIHSNTLASMLLVAFPSMESALSGILPAESVAIAVCACVMAASVVHSFVDFVPSVFIGAPDSEDAVSVLPGHRLVLQGRGMEAVRAAAIGSLVGCAVSILQSVPLQYAMLNGAGPVVEKLTPAVLVFASGVIVLSEFSGGGGPWALAEFLLAGALGYMCMELPIPCTGILGEGTLIFPMLTGLFGIPVLLESSGGNGKLPEQRDGCRDPVGPVPGLKGVVTGCIAGWFPGITSTVGASMSACFMPDDRPERFVSTVASVGTVTSVLSLVTLSVTGSGRSGSAIVVREIIGDGLDGFMSEGFILMLISMAVSAVAGYALTIWAGRMMTKLVKRIDQVLLGRSVIILLVVLVGLMTGPGGLVVLLSSTVAGFMPTVFGTGRTVLCGCLILPVLLFRASPTRNSVGYIWKADT